jgi:hypothetical protein
MKKNSFIIGAFSAFLWAGCTYAALEIGDFIATF